TIAGRGWPPPPPAATCSSAAASTTPLTWPTFSATCQPAGPARSPPWSAPPAAAGRLRRICAPRGAPLYSRRSREELGGRFLGLMAYPAPKGLWGQEHARKPAAALRR